MHRVSSWSRRRILAGAGLTLTAALLPRPLRAAADPSPQAEIAPDGFRVLRTRTGTAHLRGAKAAPTPIWGYDGVVPGPTLRVKQGEEVKVRLVNGLDQPTVIHWHGQRLPNAMDGVPHLTQAPVAPGASFDYRFTARDAGTFWYHTHFGSSEQLARGLYGVLIVDEPTPPQVDQDLMLVVDDWRLTEDGTIHPSFGNLHDAAHAGRFGQYITLNSADTLALPVRRHQRLRLRLVNTANARVLRLRLHDHAVRVIAIDGQPAEPFLADNGAVILSPGSRVDALVDATGEAGARAAITVDDLRGGELEVGHLAYADGAPVRPAPLPEAAPLPDNPLPKTMDFKGALRVDVPIEGGMMSRLLMQVMREGRAIPGQGIPQGERLWTLAGIAASGHDGPPLFRVERGRTVVLTFANQTAFPHAMHVHGHHMRQLDRVDDGWKPYWLDTVLVDVERTERVAFVADNPGKWMMHCHMIEHMATGMAAWFEVT